MLSPGRHVQTHAARHALPLSFMLPQQLGNFPPAQAGALRFASPALWLGCAMGYLSGQALVLVHL